MVERIDDIIDKIKEEITAALKLAKGLNGQVVSASSFLARLSVSNESKEAIQAEMKDSLYGEQFKLIYDEMNKLIAFKTVELDNGALLSAETTKFEEVFDISEIKTGKFEFTTQGAIIKEKVRKTK